MLTERISGVHGGTYSWFHNIPDFWRYNKIPSKANTTSLVHMLGWLMQIMTHYWLDYWWTAGAVPDSLVLQVLEERLSRLDCSCRGWILHGFPRDLQQAKSLQESQHQPNRYYTKLLLLLLLQGTQGESEPSLSWIWARSRLNLCWIWAQTDLNLSWVWAESELSLGWI